MYMYIYMYIHVYRMYVTKKQAGKGVVGGELRNPLI